MFKMVINKSPSRGQRNLPTLNKQKHPNNMIDIGFKLTQKTTFKFGELFRKKSPQKLSKKLRQFSNIFPKIKGREKRVLYCYELIKI